VFFNLLSNALKFTPDFGFIKIVVNERDDLIDIRVVDSGPGVEDSLKNQVFERFYERNSINYSNSEGIGIGLALTKQLVELHHGKIYVVDNSSLGSVFVVELIKGSAHFSKTDLETLSTEVLKPILDNELVIEEKNDKSAKLELLIVEDDLEIREYIQSLFKGIYKVSLADNGLKGFEMAYRNAPDIIISDVMMPEMDGITMCGKLKTTLETSHIPIILLTARSATPFKIGGLETGADDYITKPFNSDELLLKTKNLLAARDAYLEKLARTHDFKPERIAITSTDERFLNRLVELTEENIENSNFTVEQIADHLNVSRALLFTKMKSLTGKTPKGFIKDFRLIRATQLLIDTDLNLTQIAHKSGFQDYRYFTKVFKSQYGVSPKEYCQSEGNRVID
jgi:DNA-binding response OmpR family regulator